MTETGNCQNNGHFGEESEMKSALTFDLSNIPDKALITSITLVDRQVAVRTGW